MIFIFWILLITIAYCYFGYPIVLSIVNLFLRREPKKGEHEPAVSVVLSIWNEEDVIKGKIENLLSLDYPADKIEILIGSDGSTDRTNAIIHQFDDPRIHLIEGDQRRGKMATINDLVKKTKNEILVFTDARQDFEKDAIRALIANFCDPQVGCVSGELVFSKKKGATARGINLYWNYEKFIRHAESNIHSMLGATGAIYAIRRKLFEQIPENIVLDDMFVPFKIIQRGYRAVFEASARAYDEVADSPRQEHRRKARTLFGNYQIFWTFRKMFDPFNSPIAIQFFSHKFLRVLMPFCLIAIFMVNWSLTDNLLYQMFFDVQMLFYVMAFIGALARHQKYGILKGLSKVCYVPYVFCLLNFSALVGFLRFIGSSQEIRWQKARGE